MIIPGLGGLFLTPIYPTTGNHALIRAALTLQGALAGAMHGRNPPIRGSASRPRSARPHPPSAATRAPLLGPETKGKVLVADLEVGKAGSMA